MMFLIKCNVIFLSIGTVPCLGMEPETEILVGISQEILKEFPKHREWDQNGVFKIFRKFYRDTESYKTKKDIWKSPHYKEVLDNANKLFIELSNNERYKKALAMAQRATKDYFYETNLASREEMYYFMHNFKCTVLNLLKEKLNEKNISLQIPSSDSPADFLHLNATINPTTHSKDFMAVMLHLPWIAIIQKNTFKTIKEKIKKEQQADKIIISD